MPCSPQSHLCLFLLTAVMLTACVTSSEPSPPAETSLATVVSALSVAPQEAHTATNEPMDRNLITAYAQELQTIKRDLPGDLDRQAEQLAIHRAAKERNQDLLRKLAATVGPPYSAKTPTVAQPRIEQVFEDLRDHDSARPELNHRYDPTGSVGFCFGRAAYVHLRLLQEGFAPDDMRKIYVVGKLRHGNRFWDYHMATMLRDGRQWWVIDSLFDRVLPLADWAKAALAFGIKREQSQARLYVSDPRKFQPAYGAYQESHFKIPELAHYFEDLFRTN